MENIDNYLKPDADERDRAAARRLQEGFDELRLQAQVQRAAANRRRMRRQARGVRVTAALLVLLLLLGLGWWWTGRQTPPAETPPTTTQTTETPPPAEREIAPVDTPAEETPPSPREAKPETTPPPPPPNVPIAQAEPALPPPPYGAPDTYLRGGATEAASDKTLLDQVWYTAYPLMGLDVDSTYVAVDQQLKDRKFTLAYVRLQRLERQVEPNDTLAYLQAYTLLEMGQGAEAADLLANLERPAAAWRDQVEWYQALALLLDRRTEAALTRFKEIAARQGHAFRREARKVLELYQDQ